MKLTRPATHAIAQASPASTSPDVWSRFKLAFLDEYTGEKRGYDPYDTSAHRGTPDIWASKRKRA